MTPPYQVRGEARMAECRVELVASCHYNACFIFRFLKSHKMVSLLTLCTLGNRQSRQSAGITKTLQGAIYTNLFGQRRYARDSHCATTIFYAPILPVSSGSNMRRCQKVICAKGRLIPGSYSGPNAGSRPLARRSILHLGSRPRAVKIWLHGRLCSEKSG
jgi:hypothetical protein